jgi:MerR family transcriptional regulator, light-induced transcriptional regulator
MKYSIKDLERISGIKAHTIRIWEQRHNILNPTRTETNIRQYSCEDLKKIITLGSLNARGLKISKLASLNDKELGLEVLRHSQNSEDVEFQIEKLVTSMIDFDGRAFDNVLRTNIEHMGFDGAFERLIYPFFDRVGVLWQLGSIDPAQEHLISNLIRQRLIIETDKLLPKSNNDKILCSFLPEGEYHELGLLYYSYLAVKEGFELSYYGQSTPYSSVKTAIENKNPDLVLFSFVQSMELSKLQNYIHTVTTDFPRLQICVSGAQAIKIESNPPHLSLMSDANDFRKKIREILSKN